MCSPLGCLITNNLSPFFMFKSLRNFTDKNECSFGFFRTFSNCLYINKNKYNISVITMNKQLVALGVIGILIAIIISGCLEEKTAYVTFTVYKEFQERSENITIYGV